MSGEPTDEDKFNLAINDDSHHYSTAQCPSHDTKVCRLLSIWRTRS